LDLIAISNQRSAGRENLQQRGGFDFAENCFLTCAQGRDRFYCFISRTIGRERALKFYLTTAGVVRFNFYALRRGWKIDEPISARCNGQVAALWGCVKKKLPRALSSYITITIIGPKWMINWYRATAVNERASSQFKKGEINSPPPPLWKNIPRQLPQAKLHAGKKRKPIFIHMTYYAAPSFNFHERRIIILWAYGFRRGGPPPIFDHQEMPAASAND